MEGTAPAVRVLSAPSLHGDDRLTHLGKNVGALVSEASPPPTDALSTFLYNPGACFFDELDEVKGLTLDTLVARGAANTLNTLLTDDSALVDGRLGQLYGARFVDRPLRTNGEFGYAYRVEPFRRAVSAMRYLEAIPKEQLVSRLQEVDAHNDPVLLKKVFELAVGELPELSLDGKAAIQAAFREAVTGIQAALAAPTASSASSPEGAVSAAPPSPVPDIVQVAARLEQDLERVLPTKARGAPPTRYLMERVLMEAGLPPPILSDIKASQRAGYPDQILQGIYRTMKLMGGYLSSPAAAFNGHFSYLAYDDALGLSLPFKPTGTHRIEIERLPYTLGADGLIYNMSGRPHRVDAQGELQALPQLNHYYALRRIAQANNPVAALTVYTQTTRDLFSRLSSPQGQDALKKMKAPQDLPAIRADDRLDLEFGPTGNDAYVELFDPAQSTPEALFGVAGHADGTAAAYAMSRYLQLDLELWGVHAALAVCHDGQAGDSASAEKVKGYRAALHSAARAFLEQLKDAAYQSPIELQSADQLLKSLFHRGIPNPGNPLGLHKLGDLLMYHLSPLRYASFDDYLAHEDDNTMFLWRGDRGTNRFLGIYADHNPSERDALTLARARSAHNGAETIIDAIEQDEESSRGTGLISDSTDASAAATFASSVGDGDISQLSSELQSLLSSVSLKPGERIGIRTLTDVEGFLDPAHRLAPGQADLSGMTLADVEQALDSGPVDPPTKQEILNRASKLLATVPNSPFAMLTEVAGRAPLVMDLSDLAKADPANPWVDRQDMIDGLCRAMDAVRDYIIITQGPSGPVVQFPQKVLLLRVSKHDVTPGCQSQENQGNAAEQEAHMWRQATPAEIVGALPGERLLQTLPMTHPPEQTAAPAAGPDGGAA
jgi:hypothetical protein